MHMLVPRRLVLTTFCACLARVFEFSMNPKLVNSHLYCLIIHVKTKMLKLIKFICELTIIGFQEREKLYVFAILC